MTPRCSCGDRRCILDVLRRAEREKKRQRADWRQENVARRLAGSRTGATS